ncbi:flagellar hook-associated protein 3 [Ruminiclostridium hungatei]|uniref:Flagellar hook-associated protein 3 n=1 Tax=Ruminiclostridium hungatei TaxID=48256 RepID=A0A1V4SQV3_RUMHU|nr:flagellar hook-associated protein FlgL [Ruminiclostridium hungatei]OPX45671.1 flagellar hook-associated protein 3 [Ruminiclostridium hungatei]
MRVTNNMIISNMLRNLGNNTQRMSKYQNQLDSGKKISVPSDDPVVAARALKLRTDVAKVEQYQKNINDAKSWLDTTDVALGKIGDVLQKARELTVQASNSTNTPEETQKIALELKQLRVQAIHLANSSYAGRYIFSGFKTDQKLINDDEDSPNFGQFSIDVNTVDERLYYEIGVGDSINVNVAGGDIFNNGGDAANGTVSSMIQMFNEVISYMDAGQYTQTSNMLDDFDREMGNVLRARADVGARQNRVDLTADRMSNDLVNFTDLMSKNEDVDIAETIMNLKNEENVYQASLAGGARIIQQTLVDFLR